MRTLNTQLSKLKVIAFAFAMLLGTMGYGQIQFQLIPSTPFEAVLESDIKFADVDGDLDQDLILTGRNNGSSHISRLYFNDGNANFTWDSEAAARDWLSLWAIS